jgi:transcriptional regulator with XRE-family HTH domain
VWLLPTLSPGPLAYNPVAENTGWKNGYPGGYNKYVMLNRPMRGAELIRLARSRRGLTQAELARRLGTSQSAIARWERGDVSPRVETLNRVLEACGFRADVELRDGTSVDRDQLRERLQWSPAERLRYLVDMLAFEERARRARRL